MTQVVCSGRACSAILGCKMDFERSAAEFVISSSKLDHYKNVWIAK